MPRPSAAGGFLAVGEAGQHGVDDRVERESPVDVQFGREPDFGVHDVVGRQVFDALVGHPVQRIRCLHHADRVRERFEVAHQRPAVRGGAEPRRELVDAGGGQLVVAVRPGQLKHRRGPQPAVEVVVQQGLRGAPDRVQGQRCGHRRRSDR